MAMLPDDIMHMILVYTFLYYDPFYSFEYTYINRASYINWNTVGKSRNVCRRWNKKMWWIRCLYTVPISHRGDILSNGIYSTRIYYCIKREESWGGVKICSLAEEIIEEMSKFADSKLCKEWTPSGRNIGLPLGDVSIEPGPMDDVRRCWLESCKSVDGYAFAKLYNVFKGKKESDKYIKCMARMFHEYNNSPNPIDKVKKFLGVFVSLVPWHVVHDVLEGLAVMKQDDLAYLDSPVTRKSKVLRRRSILLLHTLRAIETREKKDGPRLNINKLVQLKPYRIEGENIRLSSRLLMISTDCVEPGLKEILEKFSKRPCL